MKDCESCNGSGMLYYFMNDMRCNICKGSGKTPEETYLSSAKKVNSYLAKTQLDESKGGAAVSRRSRNVFSGRVS